MPSANQRARYLPAAIAVSSAGLVGIGESQQRADFAEGPPPRPRASAISSAVIQRAIIHIQIAAPGDQRQRWTEAGLRSERLACLRGLIGGERGRLVSTSVTLGWKPKRSRGQSSSPRSRPEPRSAAPPASSASKLCASARLERRDAADEGIAGIRRRRPQKIRQARAEPAGVAKCRRPRARKGFGHRVERQIRRSPRARPDNHWREIPPCAAENHRDRPQRSPRRSAARVGGRNRASRQRRRRPGQHAA